MWPSDYNSPFNYHHPDQHKKRFLEYSAEDGWGRKLWAEFDVAGLVNRNRETFVEMLQRCREWVNVENRRLIDEYVSTDWIVNGVEGEQYGIFLDKFPTIAKGWIEHKLLWREYFEIVHGAPSQNPLKSPIELLTTDERQRFDEILRELDFRKNVLLYCDGREDYGPPLWVFRPQSQAPLEVKFLAVTMLFNHFSQYPNQIRLEIDDDREAIWWHIFLNEEHYGKEYVANTGEEVMRTFLTDVRSHYEAEAGEGGKPTLASKKKSTQRGDSRSKLIAALTLHHQYNNGSCLNFEPIGNNELARQVNVSPSTASGFFKEQFSGLTNYRAACGDPAKLIAALKLLNGEFTPEILYGAKPLDRCSIVRPVEEEREDDE